MLKDEFNIIEVVFQTPRSPFLNFLYLGMLCSLQEKAEREHLGSRSVTEALAQSVMKTWHLEGLDGVITKVHT